MAAVLKEEEFVEARIARLESDVAHIRTDVSELKKEMGEVRRDIGDVRKELGSVKEILAGHQGQFAALRVEMNGLVGSLRAEMIAKIAENRVWTLMTLAGVVVMVLNTAFHWL
jgi:uncharacterized coiled-coil protein SlyX